MSRHAGISRVGWGFIKGTEKSRLYGFKVEGEGLAEVWTQPKRMAAVRHRVNSGACSFSVTRVGSAGVLRGGPGAGEAGVRDTPLSCVWCSGVRIPISGLVGGRGGRGPYHPYICFDSSCPSTESGAELGRRSEAPRQEGEQDKPFPEQDQRFVSLQLSSKPPRGAEQTPAGCAGGGGVRVSLCPPAHTAASATHLSPCVFVPLPAKQGHLQTPQEPREIPYSSEHPPRTEGTRGDPTTHNASCRLDGDESPLTL